MAACSRCGGRLHRAGARCPHCGALEGELSIEPLGDVAGTTSSGEVDLGRPSVRRRPVIVVAGAVVALGLGALLVSRGGSHQALPEPTTSVPSTTAAPTTTRPPATTTTTTLPETFATTLAQLLPEPTGGVVLYALDDVGGMVLRVDLDAGTVTGRRFADGPMVDGEPRTVVARSGGALVLPMYSNDNGRFVPDDAAASVVTLRQDGGQLIPAADPSLLWRVIWPYGAGSDLAGRTVTDAGRRAMLVGLDGQAVSPALPIPSAGVALGDDGRGDLLLATLDGTYTLAPGTGDITRADGDAVLAWSAGELVTARCDDSMACRFRVVDRAGGQDLLGGPVPDDLQLYSPVGLLDPTGRRLARYDGASMQVVTLADGQVQRLAPASFPGGGELGRFPFAWSPDGRWLFWPDESGRLAAWHDGLTEPLLLALDEVEVLRAVSVAPPPAA